MPGPIDELEKWKSNLRQEISEFKKALTANDEDKSDAAEAWAKLCWENPTCLPARVQSPPSKVIHWNLAKAVASPPVSWRVVFLRQPLCLCELRCRDHLPEAALREVARRWELAKQVAVVEPVQIAGHLQQPAALDGMTKAAGTNGK